VQTQNPNYVAPPPEPVYRDIGPLYPASMSTRGGGAMVGADAGSAEPLPSESGMYGGMGGGLDLGGVGRTRGTTVSNPVTLGLGYNPSAIDPEAERVAFAEERRNAPAMGAAPYIPRSGASSDLENSLRGEINLMEDAFFPAYELLPPEVQESLEPGPPGGFPEGTAGVAEMANIWGGFGGGPAGRRAATINAADDAIAARAARPSAPARGRVMEEALDVASDTNVGLVDAQGNSLPRIAGPEPIPVPPQTMTGNAVMPNRVTYPNPRTMTGNSVVPSEPTFRPAPPPDPISLPAQTMTGSAVMPNRLTYPNPRTVTGDAVVPSTKRVAGETFVEPPSVEAPIRQPTTTVSGRPSLGQANADVVTELPATGWHIGRAEKGRPVPAARPTPEPPAVGGEVFRPAPPAEPIPAPVEVGGVVARDLPPLNKNVPAAPKKGGVYKAPPPRDVLEPPVKGKPVVEAAPVVEQPVNLVEAPVVEAPVTSPPAKTTGRGGKLARVAKGTAKVGAVAAAASLAANKLIYPDGVPVNETGADHVVNPSGDGTYNPRDPNDQALDELWATQDRIDRGERGGSSTDVPRQVPISNLHSTDIEREMATVIKATGKPPATVEVEPRVNGISVWRDTETGLPLGFDDGTDFTGAGSEITTLEEFDQMVADAQEGSSQPATPDTGGSSSETDAGTAKGEAVSPSAPKSEGATPIYESSPPANDGGGSSGGSPVYSNNSYDNNNYGYEPSPGGSTTRRGASRTDVSADVSSLFGDLADSGDLVLEDFYKDYDGDGVITAKDRRKGKLAFAAAKKKRRGMRRSGRTGTSTMPVRTDSALRSQILAALDASMAS
jgi:hypothetical protein